MIHVIMSCIVAYTSAVSDHLTTLKSVEMADPLRAQPLSDFATLKKPNRYPSSHSAAISLVRCSG